MRFIEEHRRLIVMFLMGVALGMVLSGCTSTDPSRFIMRNCPVESTGNCYYNAVAISRWAIANGIEARVKLVDCKYGRKVIKNGHAVVEVEGGRDLEYVDGIGIVRR